MAKQTWDANRTGGGTYEFSQDAQGNYSLNSVGFQKLGKFNLPDLGVSTTQTTKKDTTTDTAKLSKQTTEAFGDVKPFYYDQKGGGADQYTKQYEMTKDKSLATDQSMVSSDRQPGFEVSNTLVRDTRPEMLGDYGGSIKRDTIPAWAKDADKRGYENITFGGVDEIPADKKQAKRAQQKDLNRFPGMVGPQKPSPYQDAIMRGQRGVKYEKPGIPQKFTEAKTTALKKVNTVSNTLSKALGFVMDNSLIGRVLGSVKETPTDKHAKTYFNINPAEGTI